MTLDNLKNQEYSIQNPEKFTFEWTKKLLGKEKIPQELKDFRKKWENEIQWITKVNKEKIIRAANKINVKVETENNWNRLVEFVLWDKLYKFYDFNIKLNQYQWKYEEFLHSDRWNPDDDDDFWWNMTRKEREKNSREWFHDPEMTKMNELFDELWKNAGLSNKSEKLWMFMYLTWMSWEYVFWEYNLNLKYDDRERGIYNGDGYTQNDAKSCTIQINNI
jgi:hypothetical protein